MAITTHIQNDAPFVRLSGMATKIKVDLLPENTQQPISEVDACEIGNFYNECVFGSNTNDWWKNDETRVSFYKFLPTDTVNIELHKDNNLVEVLDGNSTLGVFENGFTNGENVSEQTKIVSFLLKWKDVLLAHGFGNYQIKAQLTVIGAVQEFVSVPYFLQNYSDKLANKTVRVEWYADGKINGSLFDYSGLNLYHSRRIKGDFIENVETLEISRYKTNFEEWRQNTDKVIENYEIRTKLIPREVTANLSKFAFLGNEILITDYKLKAEALYRRISVYPESYEKQQQEENINSVYSFKFVARKELNIKRNF